ncbi:hypothetical protein D0T84_14470 [Dysgonomonas sp. 521]|uniref:UPF0158 family protein n=1 Tax=Dysgonomonas sp. 521 TaxID=2302932 RepID=UPI0013D36CCB|nr:UPF0158 family protein [Dysgonomonas sp. 521]NDV96107.1 hypothetical protein [Dysgonomonas sp. 521]
MDQSKYPENVIRDIAQHLDIGMICYFNTDTMEIESVLGQSYMTYFDDDYQEVYDKVETWEHSVRIEPPESWQSFKFMEDFIEYCIPDSDPIKRRLWTAISKRKPFQNFKYIIDYSKYRQSWFDFKQMELEKYVREHLL